jgi:hypothetical protein
VGHALLQLTYMDLVLHASSRGCGNLDARHSSVGSDMTWWQRDILGITLNDRDRERRDPLIEKYHCKSDLC